MINCKYLYLSSMNTSAKGLDFIIKEEGLILHPYKDAAGYPTIGIGSRYYEDGTPVKMTDKSITRDRAIQIFKVTLKYYEAQVNKSITRCINQNQFDALTSMCYNIGVNGFAGSTAVKIINQNPCDPKIGYYIQQWRNAGGKPILLGRRQRETNLYYS